MRFESEVMSKADRKEARIANAKQTRQNAKKNSKQQMDFYLQGLISKEEIVYNIFGSPNGADIDVLVSISLEMLELSPCYIERAKILYSEVLRENYQNTPEYSNISYDVNLVYVNDGVIKWVEHGTIWETTNALLDTYRLHTQKHKCFVCQYITPTDEQINKKLHRSVRNILSVYTRSVQYRDDVKRVLLCNYTLQDRLNVIKTIDNENNTWMDIRNDVTKITTQNKRGCYQVLQALNLLRGQQLYTKESLLEYYPSVRPFLYREDTSPKDYINLEVLFNKLIDAIEERAKLGLINLNDKEV